VRIHEVGQLFNSIDPSPFTERDLDDDAEAYIVGWVREVHAQGRSGSSFTCRPTR
jgi:hypothetical protein